ncbi:hypothetical protein ASD88_05590 [Pelomonas sp. Root662]|nr:hypothetical protein ASC81_05585 [Pelomonas sp. Root405]KRA78301.1 hypothetical protein ASD88_05590 [Pelomonas sp. Root662]
MLTVLLQQSLLLCLGIALLRALRPLLKRLSAGATYAAWLLLPALLLTPALPRPQQEPLAVVLQAAAGGQAGLLPALPAPLSSQAPLWLLLWLGGAVVVVAVQARRQRRLARFGDRLPAGTSPALVGLLRPRIALPADFESRFDVAERELVIAHEQVHRDRLDNLWNLLACAITALHWWNPLAWWAARRMQADQELACDAAVLATRPAATAIYTRALLAAHGLNSLGAPLASRWGTTHPLVERIEMLNHPRLLPRRRAAVLCAALLGIIGAAYAAQGSEPDAPVAASAQKIEIQLQVSTGEFKASPRLITTLGARTSIQWGATPASSWRLDFTVTQDPDGQLQVVTEPRYGDKPLARHTGHVASGKSVAHRVGGNDVPTLQMTRVVKLLPADFKMPP